MTGVGMRRNVRSVGAVITAVMVGSAVALASAPAANALTVNAGGSTLNFSNASEVGASAKAGFQKRYTNVVSGVDAILSVKTVHNLTLSYVDRVASSGGDQVMTKFSSKSGGGYVTYTFDFVSSGTTTPVTLQNIAINVADIDAKQYVDFAGVQSYSLANPTLLTATSRGSGAYRFAETAGVAAANTDTRYWAQVNYDAISSVDVTLGSAISGFAVFDIAFGAASWGVTPVVPVTPPMVQYAISYDGNGAVGGTVPASTTHDRGVEHALASNTYINGNATFMGWNTSPDGLGTMFPASGGITPSENMTLYAIWQVPNEVDLGGENGDPSSGVDIPVDVTDLDPGSDWELTLIPKNPPGDPIPLDEGTVTPEGEAHGGGELPPDLPEGEYEVIFTSKDPDGGTAEIVIPFDVDGNGDIANKGETVRVALANTSGYSDVTPVFAGGGMFVVVLGGVLLFVSRRRKTQTP